MSRTSALLSACLALAASPARAGGCLSALESSLGSGRPEPALSCFAPDAAWLDGAGASSGTAAVRAGLARLASEGVRPEGALSWTRLSTGTWLLAGLSGGAAFGARDTLLVLDLAGGAGFWSAARVYRAARPWPTDWAGGLEAPPAAEAAASFNRSFGAGDVEGWVARWAPDAVFVSVVGPFAGAEVGGFFRHQAERYLPPRYAVSRDHGAAADGALVLEGTLSGRCRGNGSPFAFPFIMRIGQRGGRIYRVYEAFASLDDGCGPFWTEPR